MRIILSRLERGERLKTEAFFDCFEWKKFYYYCRILKSCDHFVTKHAEYSLIGRLHRPPIKTKTSKTAFIRYNRGFIFLCGESGPAKGG